jgi:hypothetical protein
MARPKFYFSFTNILINRSKKWNSTITGSLFLTGSLKVIGDSILSGSLIVRPIPSTITHQTASLKLWGNGTDGVAEIHLSQDGDGTPGYILRYNGGVGVDDFEINKEDGTTQLAIDYSSGTVRIPGTISASGKFFGGTGTGGITFGVADRLLTIDSATGEFKQRGIAAALAASGIGLLSSSQQIAADISGSWQGQNFISASQTFLSTGQRSGNASITGSLFLVGSSGHLTASGNISASGFLRAQNITASANISASGTGLFGMVGIGTASPTASAKLHVHAGSIFVTPVTYAGNVDKYIIKAGASNNSSWDGFGLKLKSNSGGSPYMSLHTSYATETMVLRGPKVGIGINNPTASLHVVGNIWASGSNGNIISSANISASGYLNAKLDPDTTSTFKTVMYDTTTGRLSTTGSYGGGGGSTFTDVGISGSWQSQYFNTLTAVGISGSFTPGEGIDINSGVISGEDASLTNKGIAKFNTANFAVTSGDVTIKDGGVANIKLVNDGITIAGVDTSLGETITAATILNAGESIISGSWQSQYFNTLTAVGISGSFTPGEGIDINSGVISGEDASLTNKGIAKFNTANFAVTSGDVTIKDGGVANIKLVNDGITIAGVDTSLGETITAATILNAGESIISGSFTLTSASIATNIATNVTNITTNTNAISALNSAGLISASVLTSPAQGQARLTTNGVATTVDLGLETTDKPEFAAVTSSLLVAAANMFIGADYDNNSGNSSNIFFQTKGNTRMTLSGSGNVGIGTTTPTEKLTVVGNISTTSHITASGNISASGKLYGGLASTITPSAVYYNPVGGELSYGTGFTAAGISGSWQSQYFNTVTAAGISGSLGSNAPLIRSLTAAGISGSWQSQPFANLNATAISGSFLLNTTDTFTGQLKVEGSISSSGNIYLGNVGSESSLIFGGQAGDSAKIFTLHNLSQTELIIQTTDDGNDNIRIQTNGWNNANSGSIYLTSEDVNISGRATTGQYVKFDGDNARVGIGTASPGEKLEVIGNISASGTLSAGLTQASGSHITYYNTSSGLFTYEAISEPPVDKVRFSGLNIGDTTVEDDGGSTAEFTLSGSTSLGIKVRGDNATSTIGIELSTVSIPEVTLFEHNSGGDVFSEDSFIIHDVSAGVVKRIIASNIPVEAFDNSVAQYITPVDLVTLAGLEVVVRQGSNTRF